MNESGFSESRPRGGVVFAVDDEENDRQLLGRALTATGLPYTCRFFRSGDELLDGLISVLRGSPPPALCLIDVKMAGMSGLDVLRWIRAQHGLDGIPVVMLSSSDRPEYLSEAAQFGAQCYATKFPSPDQWREILQAAESYVEASSACAHFPLRCNLLARSEPAIH